MFSFRINTYRIHLKILRNRKFYRTSIDSHQINVKTLIQGMLSWWKDDLWALLYIIANGACPSGTEKKRLRHETDR